MNHQEKIPLFPSDFQRYIDDLEILVMPTPRDVQASTVTAGEHSSSENRESWEYLDDYTSLSNDNSSVDDFDHHCDAIGDNGHRELRDRTHQDSSWHSDIEDYTNIAHVYIKLPPPKLPMIPILEREITEAIDSEDDISGDQQHVHTPNLKTYNVSNNEDFEALKERVEEYLSSVERRLKHAFRFIDKGEDIVYHQITREGSMDERLRRKPSHRPTAVILKNAIDAADDLMDEIERSYQETVLRQSAKS